MKWDKNWTDMKKDWFRVARNKSQSDQQQKRNEMRKTNPMVWKKKEAARMKKKMTELEAWNELG